MSSSLKGVTLKRRKPYVAPVKKAVKPTLKQKYDYLLSKMKITDISLWEQDACVRMAHLYFQFDNESAPDTWSIDQAVVAAINTEL